MRCFKAGVLNSITYTLHKNQVCTHDGKYIGRLVFFAKPFSREISNQPRMLYKVLVINAQEQIINLGLVVKCLPKIYH